MTLHPANCALQMLERFEREVRSPGHRMASLVGLAGDDAAKATRPHTFCLRPDGSAEVCCVSQALRAVQNCSEASCLTEPNAAFAL